MGCDIHLHVEVKDKATEEWVLFEQPVVNRNYELFEKMAGVRGEEYNAIAAPRYVPTDASRGTMIHLEYMYGDAHTHSWLNNSEIRVLRKWWNAQDYKRIFEQDFGYLFGNGYELEEYADPLPISDVRFVFWFDN